MTLCDFIILIVLVALLVKFLWTVAEKWGILEWMQAKAPCELIHQLLCCEFCRSFWLGCLLCLAIYFVTKEPIVFAIPIFSCNIR